MGSPCCLTETRRKATRPLYVPSPMQPRLWLLLATSVSCATPRTPIAENARCEGCHESEAREWRSSLHRASHEDPTYRASFRREPQAFCTQCHAPLGLESASIGVGCTSCHGKDHESGKLAEATCVGCHEFSFPDRARSTAAEDRMQLTATEHTDSAFANASCSSCHMPSSGARKSHVFAASRDLPSLQRAVRVGGVVQGDIVNLTVEPGQTGHAFPTGDLFRRARVGVELIDENGERVDFAIRDLSRTFEVRERHTFQLADTRPGAPGQGVVRLSIKMPGASRGRVRYWLDYERMETVTDVEQSTRVLEGWIQ